MRGLSFLKLGVIDSARYYLEKHVGSEADEVGLKYVSIPDQIALSEVYRQDGQLQKAVDVLKQAMVVNAPTAELSYHLALVETDRKNHTQGLQLLKEASQSVEAGTVTTRPYVDEFFVPDQWMIDQAIARCTG